MININLLPEGMRKKERMPLPQFLGVLGAVIVFSLLGAAIYNYSFSIIPELERRRNSLNTEKAMLKKQAAELQTLNAEIAKLTSYVDTVKGLYRQRIVWAKILSDIKRIVDYDPMMNEYNTDMRYIWFTKLNGNGKKIALTGFATASTQIIAMPMLEVLFQNFNSYAPTTLPEKDEEAKLTEELRVAQSEHDSLRRENPDLPLQGQRELELRKRLEEIQNIKSGGIAMQPFANLMMPTSLILTNSTWGTAPTPRVKSAEAEEMFPTHAWSFGVELELR